MWLEDIGVPTKAIAIQGAKTKLITSLNAVCPWIINTSSRCLRYVRSKIGDIFTLMVTSGRPVRSKPGITISALKALNSSRLHGHRASGSISVKRCMNRSRGVSVSLTQTEFSFASDAKLGDRSFTRWGLPGCEVSDGAEYTVTSSQSYLAEGKN